MLIAFSNGGSVKAFETGRSDVADFAARCIAERLGLPSPPDADSTKGESTR